MKSIEKIVDEVLEFRLQMGLSLSEEDIKYIWGKRNLRVVKSDGSKFSKENENRYSLEKIEICKRNISKLIIFDWVRFVGVSGSVAAGFAKEEDDIDIFVVVRNGTMWLYRGLIVFSNLFHNKIRAKRHKDVKDKLCVNLICEERGIQFENDMFNFHELMFLKPILNEKYINYLYSQNNWLEKEYGVKKENSNTKIVPRKKVSIIIRIINYLAFIAQVSFMIVLGHNPNIKRLENNNKEGRIEFFEYDYKRKFVN
jgi:predicted nucleotidyltransferase